MEMTNPTEDEKTHAAILGLGFVLEKVGGRDPDLSIAAAVYLKELRDGVALKNGKAKPE